MKHHITICLLGIILLGSCSVTPTVDQYVGEWHPCIGKGSRLFIKKINERVACVAIRNSDLMLAGDSIIVPFDQMKGAFHFFIADQGNGIEIQGDMRKLDFNGEKLCKISSKPIASFRKI